MGSAARGTTAEDRLAVYAVSADLVNLSSLSLARLSDPAVQRLAVQAEERIVAAVARRMRAPSSAPLPTVPPPTSLSRPV